MNEQPQAPEGRESDVRADASTTGRPRYPIGSVDRALQLIVELKRRPAISLAEASAVLGVGRSTAHRLMAMLVYRGFGVQDPVTRSYRAGPELLNQGPLAFTTSRLAAAARPVIESLAMQSGETVQVGTLEGGDVRYVDCIESPALLRVGSRVGHVTPAYASSLGKAMLATLTDEIVASIYAHTPFQRLTEHTLSDVGALLTELRDTRARGYAVNYQEAEVGVASTARAVVSREHMGVVAFSISMPLSRYSLERVADHAALLESVAPDLIARI